ncbi:MAG: metalloregulator ArsR/SmtB family transcription factor [Actinobacteria bacterium]|nr:metalloregulator ArsR/SmtB family transcription factor [Actinomycetota bacterium]MBU1944886.1 metalloregulator ArsR/SmtB family transcription factor [Actinomycetota bacterium]MBU2688090.1 metalloregulator ArsR/SmtB family transcription factor [Actinomycetota bacterium]
MERAAPRCRKDPRVEDLAEAMKTLSDPTRIRVLCFLRGGEACVCDIEQHLGISQQLTSHHLHVMRDAGFLRMRKDGTRSLYAIDVEFLKRVCGVFEEYVDWRKVAVGAQQVKAC